MDLYSYFSKPASARMKQYEAVRAFIIEGKTAAEIAKQFGYAINNIYTLIRDAKAGNLDLFPEVVKGIKRRHTPDAVQEKIIEYRNKNLSIIDISKKLADEKIKISMKTIERILREAGFEKLQRRTDKERGVTKNGTTIPEKATQLDFKKIKSFSYQCPVAAVYCFIPYIIELGILDIIKKCSLPDSSVIGKTEAALAFLLLKLIGVERISHMDSYSHEEGLGAFANLNVLPKNTYMNTYSCMTSQEELMNFQKTLLSQFKSVAPELYKSQYINLDFHSIPHYGDDETLERVWCGAKGKTLKGANTILVQGSESSVILYTKADILRKNETSEILEFVKYWKKITGDISETLVFDCKLTKYEILGKLQKQNINFITLRKRNKKLIEDTLLLPDELWESVYLPIPKRKHKKFFAYESQIFLSGCKESLRQIIIQGHGRVEPTYIITNNKSLKSEKILEVYAKRWHIENKISELVSFFNLNALVSPLMVRIHFDMLWTVIADTLYRRLSLDLKRFEKATARTLFRKFINIPGNISYDGSMITVTMRKHSQTPVWMDVKKIQKPFRVPWLNNSLMKIKWVN